MKKTVFFSIRLIITIFSQSVWAGGSRYQVELLVFSQRLPTTEVFDQMESKIQWPTALTELSAYQETDNKSLRDSATALFKDVTYQPIVYFSWAQSTGPGNDDFTCAYTNRRRQTR